MSDEFPETDINTPTEHDVDEAYGSRFLGVTDIGAKKIRTTIVKVRKEEIKDRESGRIKTKLLVFFANIDKPLVLNVTNKNVLVDALGKPPAGWLNAAVGVLVDPSVSFGGQKKGGVRLRVLLPPSPATASKPTPADEKGDPGFDPDLNDDVPDFGATA
jgi:hypothetical protein